jgi:hypothetical protein
MAGQLPKYNTPERRVLIAHIDNSDNLHFETLLRQQLTGELLPLLRSCDLGRERWFAVVRRSDQSP